MHVKDKIMLNRDGLEEFGPINIVIFGDSVSHGAVNGYNDYERVYWNLLKKKLNAYRDYIPVNMINASIGGTTAKASLGRMEKQVFAHLPDLVIVCFGLNDVNGTLEEYLDALKQIFERCHREGCDVIFMTPNMLNTYVADDAPAEYREYAFKTAEMQNTGKMDRFMTAAMTLAGEMGVPVCDCYSKWKELAKTQDTTMLLANRINHPTSEMHVMFAESLYDMILGDGTQGGGSDSTMFRE
ncbi:MAG: SGNH/GDSL hydrolase family protein [Clostridia bacterium]|nr:SGNH/GDSL hydrolase family protein [Clostridia bacterium]